MDKNSVYKTLIFQALTQVPGLGHEPHKYSFNKFPFHTPYTTAVMYMSNYHRKMSWQSSGGKRTRIFHPKDYRFFSAWKLNVRFSF